MKYDKIRIASLAAVFLIYLFSFFLLYVLFPLIPFENSMLKVLTADIVATIVVFVFSLIFKNSSIYDPYWSVVPPIIVVFLLGRFSDGNNLRQAIIIFLVLLWSLRLTLNWIRGWCGLKHEDWRYTLIAKKTGRMYWPVSFLGIHLVPTLFVYLGCLPLWYSLPQNSPLNILDIFAAIFTLVAIVTEWKADEQLIRFRKSNSNDKFMQSGLWSISRHPNYLGEISFWLGMFLFVLSSSRFQNYEGLWTGIGFISMMVLFTFISIPLMEKRNLSRKPGYDEYVKNVPALIPRFFNK
ncbi:DUF1295 domain-containing protein [Maribellus mangrovi]|uniref:DUF1295 domain-containing protein n=1 Tax=Maribellus mangrovi TaxID=3133146 RepID=UPI0030EE7935